MKIDIRYNTNCQIDRVFEILDNTPDLSYKIYAKADPFYTDENNEYVVKYLNVCKEVLQRDVEIIECPAASDARFFSSLGMPVIMMNPNGREMHGIKECCEVQSIYKFLDILSKYLEVI